jgi:hypothetical protein
MRLRDLIAAAGVLALSCSTASAQMPPTPGPEHEYLKAQVGTWNASLEMSLPDGTAMKATGTQVETLGCGGMCLVTEFKADMMGMPFSGHGITTWDPAVKKYVGSWADSMSPFIARMEGTYDPASKKLTTVMDTRDASGNVTKMRSIDEHPDSDHKSMTSFVIGPDGKDVQVMKITYARAK